MTEQELNEWERLPLIKQILCSKQMGAWLQRRDANRDKYNKKNGSDWIPVSERLPEDESEVLATIRWYDRMAKEYRHYCVLCNYRRGIQSHYKDTWTYEHDEFGEVEAEYGGEKIVAWMPIPKPYEPREGETNGTLD